MTEILLDTNFLLLPFSHKIDILNKIDELLYEPHTLIVLESTIEELNRLSQGNGKDARHARAALALIREKKIIIKGKSLYMNVNSKDLVVDDIILQIAEKNSIVATQDKGLQSRLRQRGVRIIYLRGKNTLELR